jgi:hypothetical protein
LEREKTVGESLWWFSFSSDAHLGDTTCSCSVPCQVSTTSSRRPPSASPSAIPPVRPRPAAFRPSFRGPTYFPGDRAAREASAADSRSNRRRGAARAPPLVRAGPAQASRAPFSTPPHPIRSLRCCMPLCSWAAGRSSKQRPVRPRRVRGDRTEPESLSDGSVPPRAAAATGGPCHAPMELRSVPFDPGATATTSARRVRRLRPRAGGLVAVAIDRGSRHRRGVRQRRGCGRGWADSDRPGVE